MPSTVRAALRSWLERLGPGRLGVACSGGADSVALADAAIAELGAARVVIVTVDHALAPGSAAVAEAVAAWARSLGATALVRRVIVEDRASIEAAARDARYAALTAAAGELGLAWLLLGHTARDQAETVMMRIVRGTGPAGLAGIPPVRGRFVRPLLELPRVAIDAYVAERRLPTWDDPMNLDPRIARVRFRRTVLPALRTENPLLDCALIRLAASAREWLAAIDELAAPLARFPIDCRALAARPAAVRKRALALALDHAGLGYDAVHLEALDELVVAPARGEVALDVPGGRVVRSYDRLAVAGPPLAEPELVAPTGYELRTWRPGDRMRPARLGGHTRKLSDLYGDAKLPRADRGAARVLIRTTTAAIVWAEHVGLAFGEAPDLVPEPARSGGKF